MAWSALVFSACVTLAVACSDDNSPTDQSQPGIGVWDTRAPLPTARQEMPSALLGGRIYTPGGFDAQGATVATLEIYDVAADVWTNGPSMPISPGMYVVELSVEWPISDGGGFIYLFPVRVVATEGDEGS